jgi:hypothetical protein
MIGRKLIVVIAAIVALAGGVLLGLYGLGLGPFAPASTGQEPVADAGSASKPPAEPEAAANAPETPAPKPQVNATGAPTPPSEPTSVPTFDVVVIEPSGEGVIAGRAAPGWQVSVQSEGIKVAEAKADLQGEWSVVLEKPLPAGDHALSLKITSPDGTRALSSQESVRVAVGADAKQASAPAGIEGAATAALPKPVPQAAAPALAPSQPLRRRRMRKSRGPTKRRLPRPGRAQRRGAKRQRPRLGRRWCSRRRTMWIPGRPPAP